MENIEGFNPEVMVSQEDAASLAAIMAHPGFKVWQKISRACVDKFSVAMLNADESDEKNVLAKHRYAKVAAQLYTMQLNIMKGVVDDYIHSTPSDKPIESTENLDMGDVGIYEEEEPLV